MEHAIKVIVYDFSDANMFQFYHFNYRPKHIIAVNYPGLGWQTPALMVIAIDFPPESPSLNHKIKFPVT